MKSSELRIVTRETTDIVVRDAEEDDEHDVEAEERNDFYIEHLVEEFSKGEESVRHDVYPSSDEEVDEEVIREREYRNMRRGDGNLYLKQPFFNGVAFKENVLDYALKTDRNLKQSRYDKDKLKFICVGNNGSEGYAGCEWHVYASTLPKDPTWRIRKFNDSHSCIPNGDCEMFKVPQIARLFVDKIRDDPDYFMSMKLEEIIKDIYKISVTRAQCQAARMKALKWIETEYDEQFSRLRDYAAEIKDSNKDSIVEIDTVKNDEGKDIFNRFYVCFDAIRRTWMQTCRKIIGVDGCFLKSKMKGQLLVVLGRDADNSIYPIAWSVVQVENKENWLWFVRRLKVDLNLKDGDEYVIISDRQKGLILAVELELPKIEHRMCVRHIYANLKKNHGGKKEMKPLIWNLAWSYNETQYKERLDKIFQYDSGVYNDIIKSNPRSWTLAFYKFDPSGPFCEDVDNNSTESFNNTINKAREKPFIAMLETVRRLAMVTIARRSEIAQAHKGICTPYVEKFLASEHKQASECKVSRSTNLMYEVRLGGDYHKVCMRMKSCTCKKFDICGIPCEHAYGVILDRKLPPEKYVCSWFQTDMWRRNYTEGLCPQRGPRFWPRTNEPSIYEPPEPAQPGRKKVTKADKKRKKGVNESPTKKKQKEKKRIMHCGICGAADHNSRRHKKSKGQPSQGEPSQGQDSQCEPSQGSSQA